MPTMKGRDEVRNFIRRLPAQLEEKVLRGAARAGAKVVADEIKLRTPSEDVRNAVRMKTKVDDGFVTVRIDLKPGWGRSVGTWLEWGTEGHFISVDDSQRDGLSVRRVNEKTREGSLVINGNFVGTTVWHPGARAQPAFRPAIDTKAGDAIAAAQGYINTRLSRGAEMDE